MRWSGKIHVFGVLVGLVSGMPHARAEEPEALSSSAIRYVRCDKRDDSRAFDSPSKAVSCPFGSQLYKYNVQILADKSKLIRPLCRQNDVGDFFPHGSVAWFHQKDEVLCWKLGVLGLHFHYIQNYYPPAQP